LALSPPATSSSLNRPPTTIVPSAPTASASAVSSLGLPSEVTHATAPSGLSLATKASLLPAPVFSIGAELRRVLEVAGDHGAAVGGDRDRPGRVGLGGRRTA
jgi:hypothetical protein